MQENKEEMDACNYYKVKCTTSSLMHCLYMLKLETSITAFHLYI